MKDTPPQDTTRPTLSFDYAKYQHLLDDPALSEAEKRQCLEALWTLIVSFVELGFAVVPAGEESCGQDGTTLAAPIIAPETMLASLEANPEKTKAKGGMS